MKSLTLQAILICTIAILFQSTYSGFIDWIDWDLMLYENRIDPAKFRRYLGLPPKNNQTLDKMTVDITKPALVKCLKKCVAEDPEQPYSRHPNSTQSMYYEYPHPKAQIPSMESASCEQNMNTNTYNHISQIETFNDIDNDF